MITQEAGNPLSQYTPTTKSIVLYPNPTTGHCTIDFGGLEGMKKIEVYDMVGKTVKKMNSATKEVHLDLSPLRKGLYMVEIQAGHEIKAFKIILE
jgi:hypothetical protein